jgi:hypothetical protein
MFMIPTSGNNIVNMLVAFGLYWKSNLQINQYEMHYNYYLKIDLSRFFNNFFLVFLI